jgi:hypothetical protein
MQNAFNDAVFCDFNQNLLSPFFFFLRCFCGTKKRGNDLVFICFRLMGVFSASKLLVQRRL